MISDPWWRYLRSWFPGNPSRKPKEYHGLWREQLLPGANTGTDSLNVDAWWEVDDSASRCQEPRREAEAEIAAQEPGASPG